MSWKNVKRAIKLWNYPAKTYVPDTWPWRKRFAKIARSVHPIETYRRRELCKPHFSCPTTNKIPEELGFKSSRLSKKIIDQVSWIRDIAHNTDWSEYGQKKAYLCQKHFDITVEKRIRDLAMSPEILGPIVNYLQDFPVFSRASIWYSKNTFDMASSEYKGSQLIHCDSEDVRQVKCFIPLDLIDDDSGPLTFLPATQSSTARNQLTKDGLLKKRNQRITDDRMDQIVHKTAWVKATGDFGDIWFVDTNRCFHFGSRGQRPRLLLNLHYYPVTAAKVPFFIRNPKIYPTSAETHLFGLNHTLSVS